MIKRSLALVALLVLAALVVPAPAFAQASPSVQYEQVAGSEVVTGRISAAQPYNLWIGGVHVNMHDGTIINPTGLTLQPGMRVRILGYWNGDGTFEANQIDAQQPQVSYYNPASYPNAAQPYATVTYYGPNGYSPNSYSPYSTRPDYLTGSVGGFQPYNLWLNRGRDNLHVALHDGTVLNPTGVTLTQGMRVRVWGHWNGDGTFDANQIDVVNAQDFGY